MAYIVHWDTHPSHVFRDDKGRKGAVISAVAANASARNCDVVHVRKNPGFAPLSVWHYHPMRESSCNRKIEHKSEQVFILKVMRSKAD